MNVLFLKLSEKLVNKNLHPQDMQPNLSISYAMSLLEKENHETFLIDTEVMDLNQNRLINEIKKLKPNFIFIDTLPPLIKTTIDLCKIFKLICNPKICIINQPENIFNLFLYKNSPIDICTFGEYELTIKEIVQNKNYIKGTAFYRNKIVFTKERPLIKDLDSIGFPKHGDLLKYDYDMLYPVRINKKIKWGHIMSSRGCPYKCIFCSLRVSYGKQIRLRSIKNIVNEMHYLKSKGVNVINFVDDNFFITKERIKELYEEIKKRNLKVKWIIQTRAENLDIETLKLMKKAGCSTICFGVESGSDRILKIIKKGITKTQIINAFMLCRKMGILTVGYFIIGSPTETENEARETIKFCKQLKPDLIQVSFFTPYPSSDIYSKLKKINIDNLSHYNKISYNFSYTNSNKLKNLQKTFYKNYLLNPIFLTKFMLRRIPYSIANFKKELDLFNKSLNFLLMKNE